MSIAREESEWIEMSQRERDVLASMAEGNYPITISISGASSPSTINSDPPEPVVFPIQR